jgi:hypothetical protein
MNDERRSEFLGILERDYQAAQALMQSSNGSVDRTRTFGFALVAALIGFTLTDHIIWLGFLAAIATLVVAYVDSYHCWEYQTAFKHALRIERIDQLRYKAHLGRLNDRDMSSLEVRVGSFLPGVLAGSGRFKVYRELWFSLPRSLLFLYVLLVLVGAGAGVLAEGDGQKPGPIDIHVKADEHEASNRSAAVQLALTHDERQQLAKLATLLRNSSSLRDQALATQIKRFLMSLPETISAIGSLDVSGSTTSRRALKIILDALARTASTSPTPPPRTYIAGPQFSFGHFSLTPQRK